MRHYKDNVVMMNSNVMFEFKGPDKSEVVKAADGSSMRSEQKNIKLTMEMPGWHCGGLLLGHVHHGSGVHAARPEVLGLGDGQRLL